MEFRELAAFREVARLSSFSRAANRLGYVQSTVSAQIQSLERDLGVQLFDRLPRTVALTPAGEALLPYADRLVKQLAEARLAVAGSGAGAGEPVGTVVVSAPESLLTYRLPPVLNRIHAQHPGIVIDLRPTPIGRFRGDTRRSVATGEVDVAIVLDTPLDIRGFASEILTPEPISVIAPPGHPLAAEHHVRPEDLNDEHLLLPEAPDFGCAYRGQFERQLADAHVVTNGALEFASIETVKQCVVSGMGVSVVPSIAVEADLTAGRLTELSWAPDFDVHTQVVWNARRLIGSAVGAFLQATRSVFDST